jgi:CBS domain-containing protein
MVQTLSEVMTPNPATLPTSATVQEAAREMREKNIGDIIVTDENNKMYGIVTDRDIVVRALAEGKDPKQVKLGEIASKDVAALSPDSRVGDAVKVMSEKALRRLPVIDNGKPVGIVSLGDLAQERDRKSALADISSAPPNK